MPLFAATLGTANAQSDLVKRGDYLVNGILTCGNCHTPKGPTGDIAGKDFSGGLSWDEPPFKVTAPNITQDKETGIGNWSDADIKKVLRTGVRPNGVPIADGHADRLLRDHDRQRHGRDRRLSAHAQAGRQQGAGPDLQDAAGPHHSSPAPRSPTPKPMMSDKVKKGFYLATIGHCMECHTPMGPRGREFADKLGTGGFEFPGPWGVSVSRNITSSKTKGIGAWTDAEIKRAITTGHQQGRQQAQAADGLPLLRQDDRRRPRRRGGLSAHGAGEGVAPFLRAGSPKGAVGLHLARPGAYISAHSPGIDTMRLKPI